MLIYILYDYSYRPVVFKLGDAAHWLHITDCIELRYKKIYAFNRYGFYIYVYINKSTVCRNKTNK
jgi:hypothetical protein